LDLRVVDVDYAWWFLKKILPVNSAGNLQTSISLQVMPLLSIRNLAFRMFVVPAAGLTKRETDKNLETLNPL